MVAERLEQTLNSALCQYGRPDGLVSLCGNEYDGDRYTTTHQLTLQLGAGHPWHGDIGDEALSRFKKAGRKKLLGGCIGDHSEAKLAQEVRKRFPNRFVVIDDRDQRERACIQVSHGMIMQALMGSRGRGNP